MKFAFRFPPSVPQALASLAIFVMLLASLAWVDQRVHDKFSTLLSSGQDMGSLTHRASELVDTISTAVRYQSIENAPMVLFATVGGVLFLFMVRT
jgi:hypothetical protein